MTLEAGGVRVAGRRAAVQGGAAAVFDQFLFAGSSSLLVFLLGRGLAPDQYGAFVLAYSLFMLLAQAQTALLAEPMSVFGPTGFGNQQGAYVRAVEGLNVRAGLIAAVALTGAAGVMSALGRTAIAAALLGSGVAVVPLLAAWLRRRALYLQGRIRRSVAASSLLLAGCVGGAYGLHRLGRLNGFSGMVLLGAACVPALLASVVRGPRAGPAPPGIVRTHWEYGRWALLTALLGWCGNLYYFLLPIGHGLEGAAALRALMNFVYPAIQVNQALALFLLPRWAAHASRESFARSLFEVASAWVSFAVLLFAGAFYFGPSVMHWVYKGQYDAVAPLLPWALLLVLPDGVACVIGHGLRAGRMPHRVAAAVVPLPIVAIFPGCLFTYLWGPGGAVASMLIASAGQLGLTWWLWTRPDDKGIRA